MQDEEKSSLGSEYRRRAILRSAGLAGTSLALGSGVIGSASAATACKLPDNEDQDSEENYEWRRSKSDYYEDTDSSTYDHLTEVQSGLVYKSSTYIDDQGQWYHFFRSFGAGYTQRKESWQSSSGYEPIDWMDYQKLEISNDDTSSAALYTTSNPKEAGAAPSPENGDDLNYGPAAWTVALAALSTTSTYAAVAIPAAQALGVLLDNGESDDGDTVTYKYDYEWQNGPCEAVHFASYEFYSFDGESHCQFSVRNVITHCGRYGVENQYNVFVDPVPDNIQSTDGPTTSDTTTLSGSRDRPEPGTSEYTEFLERGTAAEKIPSDDISDPRIKELANGGPVYRARNPYTEVTQTSGRAGSGEQ